MRPSSLSLFEAKALLVQKKLSPRELLADLLEVMAEKDPAIGAYLSYQAAPALAAADQTDVSLPLGGLPVAMKDNINVIGEPCTCASRMLEVAYRSPYDATVTARLKAAGAIPFGRVNLDEFAMGSSTENSALQRTRNPHAPDRVPGGSSGGSAAAVAAKTALAALGSDTGGSIRQPASFCGVTGLKPTYGRVSRYGLVAFASSLDQIGPITRSARDAAMLLQAMAGRDPRDSTSADQPVPDFMADIGRGVQGLRIGLPREYSAVGGLHPEVKAATEKALHRLQSLGAELVEISLPHTEYDIATYYILATAEASSNLARFDGIRYGHRSANPKEIMDLHARSRGEGFGPEVKRRILLGTYVLSSGYYDAYYLKAQKMRAVIRRDFEAAFAQVDVIASPTTPAPAFKIGEKSSDPLQLYLADIFTIAANLAGVPAISVPCGFSREEDGAQLPLGLQLTAPHWQEATLLRVAETLEASA